MNRPRQHVPHWGTFLLSALVATALLAGVAHAQASNPIISQLLPGSIRAGSAGFTLTVLGANFMPGAVVRWNGSARTTVFFNSGDLEVTIPSSDVSTPGLFSVTVLNPDAGISTVATFTVTSPVPVIVGTNPASAIAGGPAFELRVLGTGFTSFSVVYWNSEPLETTFVDGSTLSVQIAAAEIAAPRSATITVVDTGPGGATSNTWNFSITEAAVIFPQIAIGGTYTTVITVVNNDAQEDNGTLKFFSQNGSPLQVSASTIPPSVGSAFSFSVPAGGVRIFTISPLVPAAPLTAGWARLDSTRRVLTGVSTFQTKEGTLLTSIAGVLPASLTETGRIPVDNDATPGVGRRTGFAIVNPGTANINVRITVYDENGLAVRILNPPELNPLGPSSQTARFLDQFWPPYANFKGSMVLSVESPGTHFAAVALSISQGPTSLGLMSVIPVLIGTGNR
ncbi:MAG: cell surface receptor domain protein [Acidobacteria bacterium]|nr:cell surface receptor domain protein [Acidobacteriota bacterium]